MAHAPLLSVCIPSYNHARFLPAALDSIMGQTFRDFEVIVVDDGSSDNSLQILQGYASRYPGIVRVLTHPGHQNRGISVSDNLALKEARGKYWCGHASDDVSYPDRFERQVAFLESHPETGWVYGIADFIDQDGARLGEPFGCDLSAFPDLAEELIFENRIAGPTAMIRMKCLIEVGPFEPGLMYGDWEYWIRLALRYPGAFLPGAVAGYRLHRYNSSARDPQEETLERLRSDESYNLEVLATLRRKAEVAGDPLGRPRMKALIDLNRAARLLLLKDLDAASVAAAAVFRDDPSLRRDLPQLAHYLYRFQSLRLPLMIIREFGCPPNWLANVSFMTALFRIGVHRIRHPS